MYQFITLLLLAVFPTLCNSAMARTTSVNEEKRDTVDILSKFTYTWNSNEWLDFNEDGSITFHAQQWGGMAAWLVENNVAAYWSDYEKLVFEFSAPTSVNTQIFAADASAWGEVGITRLECDFTGHDMSAVQQVALQTSNPTVITVTRAYLVSKATEIDEEETGEKNPEISQLVINEIMQSNIDCIMDDLNEYPDSWVELFNNSDEAINLGEYKIGQNDKVKKAWQLPSITLAPCSFILVYCDKEEDGLHTDFRIDSGKDGAVYLFHNGEIIDQATPNKKQPAPNIAYGRITNGADTWGYMYTPTPKKSNCGIICTKILGEPVFNKTGVVRTSNASIRLTLSLPEDSPEGTVIRYTTDCSEPTAESMEYTDPIMIRSTTTIRAKLFHEGYLSPRSTTHSYIFFDRNLTLPVISIATDYANLYDNKKGIYVNGTYNSNKKNYEYDWRRPINIEMFEGEESESVINQLSETRIQGGASRGSQLKSLIVYANKRFGEKRLDYEFFPDQRPGITDFKSIILRNAGNDFDYLYMRDAIIQRVMASHTDLDWQAWRPSIVYINGEYKGILNIRERSTDDNIYTNYNGLEDIDMLENWYELKTGDKENWDKFVAFYTETGHTLAEFAEWIDWREFINLMVMNLFYNNQDFPGNNIVMWRPKAEGGLWRFVAKDTDFGLGLYGTSANYNTIEWIYNPNYDSDRSWANQYEHTRLFRRMMDDKDFKREFIDHAAIYMGDFMNESGTREVWDPMYDMIKYEYPHHRKLINEWWPDYNSELTSARNWIANRCYYFYQYLGNYYELGNPIPVTINKDADEDLLKNVAIEFNGITLSKGKFDGNFYRERDVNLIGTPVNGKKVTGWKIKKTLKDGTTEETVSGDTYSFSMPKCLDLSIEAIISDEDGIEENSTQVWNWKREGNNLTMNNIPNGTPVSIYTYEGMLLGTYKATNGQIRATLPKGNIYILKIGNDIIKTNIR